MRFPPPRGTRTRTFQSHVVPDLKREIDDDDDGDGDEDISHQGDV